ncbi:hypothetical protein GGH92_009666, partial [Coemansia sp. RSA 2673]
MHTYKPSTRLYLIEWIRVLDSVPGLDLIAYLPEFLDGLIRFLSDPSDDVRNKTQSLLGELLSEIRDRARVRSSTLQSDVHAEGRFAASSESLRRAPRAERHSGDLAAVIDFARCVDILVPHVESNDQEIQATALGWVLQFAWVCPAVVVRSVPRLVNAVLPCVSHPQAGLRHTAEDVSQRLQALVGEIHEGEGEGGGSPTRRLVDEPFDYERAATAVMELFAKNVHEATKVAGMRWLLLLHRKAPWRVLTPDDMSFPVLLKILSDGSEHVVRLDLELFAQIAIYAQQDTAGDGVDPRATPYLSRFLGSLLQMFATDRVLLETRAALMVRQLCVVLDPQLVFCLFARLLTMPRFSIADPHSSSYGDDDDSDEGLADLEFISVMVQHLSWILVTA